MVAARGRHTGSQIDAAAGVRVEQTLGALNRTRRAAGPVTELPPAGARLGPARLAFPALRQISPSGAIVESLPCPRLRALTASATVTVQLDADAVVRRMPAAARLATGGVPSLPVWLSAIVPTGSVRVDASLSVARFAQLRAVDVIAGRVDARNPAAVAPVGALDARPELEALFGDKAVRIRAGRASASPPSSGAVGSSWR